MAATLAMVGLAAVVVVYPVCLFVCFSFNSIEVTWV
jgi:hypothetical protein